VHSGPTVLSSGSTPNCYYGSVPLADPAAPAVPGVNTLKFYDPTQAVIGAPIAFTVVPGQITVSAVGAAVPLPGANYQTIQASVTKAASADLLVHIAPAFVPNGVTNAIPGSLYDCGYGVAAPVTLDIPAGAAQSNQVSLSGGTVAGQCSFPLGPSPAITLGTTGFSYNPTSNSGAAPTLTNIPAPPNLVSATITGSGSSFTVHVTGWSAARDLTALTFTFTGQSGVQIAQSTVATSSASPEVFSGQAVAWFTNQASATFGGMFEYDQTFNLANGSTTNLLSVAVTATSKLGTSGPATANF
jgi:hypothetical protein